MRSSTQQKRIARIIALLSRHTRGLDVPVVEQMAALHSPYRVLISTMLSLRTKDAVTTLASKRLFSLAPNMRILASLSTLQISRAIYPVGFYPTKAKNIKKTAQILIAEYGGKVPKTIDALLQLPGVGRKVAALVVSLSYGIPAICVDTHVHRISNRLGLVKTMHPHETEQALMRILPKKYWINWNMWLVMWGQSICSPVSPKCSQCPLSPICPKKGVTNSR